MGLSSGIGCEAKARMVEDGATCSKDLLIPPVAAASKAEELFKSIDCEVEVPDLRSKDLAKSQEMFVSLVELSSTINCEASARETLPKDLVASLVAHAWEAVNLSNSIDCEVKAQDLILKDLVTSQETLASLVKELTNTANFELETRIIRTKDLATCLDRLEDFRNTVHGEIQARTMLSKDTWQHH